MHSYIERLPDHKQADAIAKLNDDIQSGQLDVSKLYRTQVAHSVNEGAREGFLWSLAGGLGGGVVTLMLVPGAPLLVPVIVSGGVVYFCIQKVRKWHSDAKQALKSDEWGYLLTDDQLREMDMVVSDMGAPATPQIKSSIEQARKILDSELEPEDAIDVPSEEVVEEPASTNDEQQLQPESRSPERERAANLSALRVVLDSPYDCYFIPGAQRTGKSFFTAVATRKLAVEKGAKIFHINLLSYTKPDTGVNEDGEYTKHCYKSVKADFFRINQAEASVVVKEALALFKEWRNTPNAILWVDEWPEMTSTGNPYPSTVLPLARAIANAISTLTSGGVKREQAVYCLGPKMVAGEMINEGRAVKASKLLYLAIAPGQSVACGQTMVTFDYDLMDQVKRNFQIEPPTVSNSPVGELRIAYAEGAWLPVGLDGIKRPDDLPMPPQEEESIPEPSASTLLPSPLPVTFNIELEGPDTAPKTPAIASNNDFSELDTLFEEPKTTSELDDLFGDTPTRPPMPEMESALRRWSKSSSEKHQLLVKLLEQLMGSYGTEHSSFTPAKLMASAWGVDGHRSGYFVNKKGEQAAPFLNALVKAGFLSEDASKYTVIFK